VEELIKGEGGRFPFFVGLGGGEGGEEGGEGGFAVPPCVGFLQIQAIASIIDAWCYFGRGVRSR